MRDVDQHIAQQMAVCEVLGLDPTQTTHVTVEWEAGKLVVIARWEGRVILTDDQVKQLGELLSE